MMKQIRQGREHRIQRWTDALLFSWIGVFLWSGALLLLGGVAPALAQVQPESYALTPLSGADGTFETVQLDGRTVWRSLQDSSGHYRFYIYFRVPDSAPRTGGPFYIELLYKDVGPGNLGLQYNAHDGSNYKGAVRGYNRLMTGSNDYRTVVFEVPDPDFRHAQNLGADMRLTGPGGDTPLVIATATLYTQPTPLFLKRSAQPWLLPYKGPRRDDVDATSLAHKVLCGYQGWFRCPGDDTETGWIHWSRSTTRLAPDTLTFDMWPDMSAYPPAEQYRAGNFTYPDGRQATLFSSANPLTVERHFDWMQTYGIDGVFVSRFLNGLDDPGEAARIIGYVRNAAARTGRVFAIEYDMTGVPPDQALDRMQRNWHWLVDVMKITDDPRYLHHNGKPVLGIYGFFTDRFDGTWANRIIDAFHTPDPYGVCLVGGCQWWWRMQNDPEWTRAFRRFDAIQPWNVGNTARRGNDVVAATGSWAGDLAEARRVGMLFLPVLYPGFSWDNLTQRPPGTSNIPRRGGAFFQEQFDTAVQLGVQQAFVAMFDEVDEGTAIFKVTNAPPTQGYFVTFEQQPSDWYLRLTGQGTQQIRRVRPRVPAPSAR